MRNIFYMKDIFRFIHIFNKLVYFFHHLDFNFHYLILDVTPNIYFYFFKCIYF